MVKLDGSVQSVHKHFPCRKRNLEMFHRHAWFLIKVVSADREGSREQLSPEERKNGTFPHKLKVVIVLTGWPQGSSW